MVETPLLPGCEPRDPAHGERRQGKRPETLDLDDATEVTAVAAE
ncbi:MAG TPA: hypothetical protein VLF66_04130 [Thermoanaerobaculia bacterium]|nr:hypothetical protein [Thermoanaerobaculia bacterium]